MAPSASGLDAQGQPSRAGCGSRHRHLRHAPYPIRIELIDSGARLTRNAEGGFYDLLLSSITNRVGGPTLLYPKQAHMPIAGTSSYARSPTRPDPL